MHCTRAAGQQVAIEPGVATSSDTASDTASKTSRFRSARAATEDDETTLERRASARDPHKGERESERLFRATFERAVVGIAHSSPEGRWLRFNRRLCDLLGYTPAELMARTFQDVTHPDDLDDSVVRLHRLLAGNIDADEWDKRYVRKDGTVVWVHLTVSLVRTPAGAPDYFITMVQDITERKHLERERAELLERERAARQQAEAALARAVASEAEATERAERLNTILETMADGVAVYDAEGHPIQPANRAYRELYAMDHAPAEFEAMTTFERIGHLHVRDAATGALLPVEATPVARALRGEVVTGACADIRMRAFDGRELEVNNCTAPLRDREGRIIGVVLLLRDMTERNRLEREREAARADELAAQEASRRMEAFLAVAAHDLRTPLTAVVGFLDLAERQTERLAALIARAAKRHPELTHQIEVVRARLEDADQGAERLTRLLARLFDTAAIRADKLQLHRVPCDLVALVREQVEAVRVAAPERAIHILTLAADGESPPVIPIEADADRVGEVVMNYLTNALKYAPADRPVEVYVEAVAPAASDGRAHLARVAVRDEGPGLPVVERARVWERFHRTPGITVQRGAPSGTEGGGLGLGLYICKAIIEAHGGRVGVESATGEGSTFWFTLPLCRPVTDPASASAG